MELFLTLMLTALGFSIIVLYVYSFILLWTDKKFDDIIKILGTILFLTIAPASWVYLIYRLFRS